VSGSILVTLTDPSGRTVVLDERGWEHISGDHPERRVQQAAIVRAVERPTFRLRGRRQGEEWFYLEGIGPSRFMKVVVRYRGNRGRVATAIPRRSIP
jgi:hypothetical protein